MIDYHKTANLFRALGEPIRLQIIDMLSCGELCACEILENLSISQPTLSHHMKQLIQAGLVNVERRATWAFYSLNPQAIADYHAVLDVLTQTNDACSCHQTASECCCEARP